MEKLIKGVGFLTRPVTTEGIPKNEPEISDIKEGEGLSDKDELPSDETGLSDNADHLR